MKHRAKALRRSWSKKILDEILKNRKGNPTFVHDLESISEANLVLNDKPQDAYTGIGKLLSDEEEMLAEEGPDSGLLMWGTVTIT